MEVNRDPLRTSDLYRFYRAGDEETLALRGVTVSLAAGEMVAVTGPSGSWQVNVARVHRRDRRTRWRHCLGRRASRERAP